MAEECQDIAKSNFNDILINLKRKFEITDSKWSNDKVYEIKFRTQIPIEDDDYNKCCDKWVDEFSYVTETVWVHKISNTGPKVKFRKQYQCWTYPDTEVNKEILFDPRKCRATVDIKVLAESTSTKKINRYFKLGLNVLVKINFYHLHEVDTSQPYAFLVHWCKPLPEAPQPAPLPNDRVSELVSKVLKSAPITVQKAAERAKKVIGQNTYPSFVVDCTTDQDQSFAKAQTANPLPESNIYPEQPTSNQNNTMIQQPVAQVIVNAVEGHANENIFYVRQIVFDSATQSLKEMVPIVNQVVQNPVNTQVITVQVPTHSHIPQIVNVTDSQII